MFGGSWVIDIPPAHPRCVVLPDPNSEARCHKPCVSGYTILDWPICDDCHDAVSL